MRKTGYSRLKGDELDLNGRIVSRRELMDILAGSEVRTYRVESNLTRITACYTLTFNNGMIMSIYVTDEEWIGG